MKTRRWLMIIVISDLVLMTAVVYYVLRISSARRADLPVQTGRTAATVATRTVKLYYYNRTKDIDPSGMVRCSPDAVLPVEREIPRSTTPIADTIRLLIEGKLSDEERAAGFTTEFPHPKFTLLGASLKDGVLTLTFPDVPSFTMGGAARVTLLAAQVEKTALQFPEVKGVRFEPESLFQP